MPRSGIGRRFERSARRAILARPGSGGGQRWRVLSATVTGNWQVDWFPQASVAVQVTIVVPMGNLLPERGTHVTWGAGSLSSVAVTVKFTLSPGGLPYLSLTNTEEG